MIYAKYVTCSHKNSKLPTDQKLFVNHRKQSTNLAFKKKCEYYANKIKKM